MSYFTSAEETSQALELPLLLRVDANPAILERHGRLSRYAAPTPQAGRLYHRLREAAAAAGSGFSPAAGGAIWVAGPWGSLEHLPWAVGLADHLARNGARVGMVEREALGPLAAIAAGGRRVPVTSAFAEPLLGSAIAAVSTDLEGVWVLLRRAATAPSGSAPVAPVAAVPWVLVTDTLPESLDGPYPSARGLTGTVLVAAYRDHSRGELEAVVRGLRSAGHRIFGLIALGPVPRPEEPSAPRAESRIAVAQEPVPATERSTRADELATPAVESPPEEAAPVETPIVEASTAETPAVDSPTVEMSTVDATPVERKVFGTPPAEASPVETPVLTPVETPVEMPVETPAVITLRARPQTIADQPAGEPRRAAEIRRDEPAAPSARRDEPAAARPRHDEPAPPAPVPVGPPAVPLLSTWERQSGADARRRTGIAGALSVITILIVAALLYLLFLRPSGVRLPGERANTSPEPAAETTAGAGRSLPAETEPPGGPAARSTVREEPTREVPPQDGPVRDGPSGEMPGPEEPPPGGPPSAPAALAGTTSGEDDEATRAVGPGADRPETIPATSVAAADSLLRAARATGDADSVPAAASLGAPGQVRVQGDSAGAPPDSVAAPGPTPGAGRFVIHLSSFKLKEEAEGEAARLQALGVLARALRVEVPDRGGWYRIVTGDFASFAEAETAALILQARGLVPYAHIAGDGGRGTPVPVGNLDRIRP